MKRIIIIFIISIVNLVQAQQKIDSTALSNLVKASVESHSDALAIWHNGIVVLEKYSDDERMIACHSMQKSLLNLCIGRLITIGKIKSADLPVYQYFPEWKQASKKEITIRHILSHTSGLDENPYDPDGWYAPNKIQYALSSNMQEKPGSEFRYNTKATYILHGLIEKASGRRLDLFLKENFFDVMEITNFRWDFDSVGNPQLLYMSAGELLKIGRLMLQKGNWNNEKLVSESWINESLKSSQPQEPECGLLWWIVPERKTFNINDSLISTLKNKGVSNKILSRFEKMKGEYNELGKLRSKFQDVFGENWNILFQKEVYPFTKQIYIKAISENIRGYQAIGWMGQYMVFYPRKNLVAVRMIKESTSNQDDLDEMRKFAELVYELVKE